MYRADAVLRRFLPGLGLPQIANLAGALLAIPDCAPPTAVVCRDGALTMLLFLGHLQSYPTPECIRFNERCQVTCISIIPHGSTFLNTDFSGYSVVLPS